MMISLLNLSTICSQQDNIKGLGWMFYIMSIRTM